MKKQLKQTSKPVLVLLAVAGWFALVVQFYLYLNGRSAPATELIIRYFTFFTILNNGIIAACSTTLLLAPSSSWGKFFSKNTTLTAMAVNITIVGTVYNTILRFLWNPQGMQLVVDELLHLVIPGLYILFWLIGVRKGGLKWNSFLSWTIFPIVYLVIVLARGAISNYYPYPFLDAAKLGYPKVLFNLLGIAIAFIVFALLFIAVDKWMDKRASRYTG